ncbi:MAG: hypothetical protein ISR89_07235 [Candidatus Marinimicrobia bacterium]|nr:hypothetical protein [Candidatus Neomarinimicrobiota bacterium]MBL7030942.1 hypothetical protein [Candidatus Neomarinimicrobiota bacterium]
MRNHDVDSLLSHIEDDLTNIKSKYEKSLREKNIPSSLRIDVKNVMENLRSCLDYMAQDIAEEIIVPYRTANNLSDLKRVYFPYGKNKQSFEQSVSRNLPNLESINKNVYFLIESIQPHSCNNTWLYDFCAILNSNKHDSLSPQERKEKQSYKVGRKGSGPAISAPAGAIKAPPEAISIGGAPVVFDSNTGIPLQTPGLEVNVTTWVSFVFYGTDLQVYPLLAISTEKIRKTFTKLYEELS